ADDAHPVVLGALEVLHGPRAERAVARAPAPHHDEPRVDVVDGLAPGALVLRLGAVGLLDGEDLGFGREVAPELGAAAEHVHEPLADTAAVQSRQAAGARAVEDRGGPIRVADTEHLARDLVERRVPGDPLELSRAEAELGSSARTIGKQESSRKRPGIPIGNPPISTATHAR